MLRCLYDVIDVLIVLYFPAIEVVVGVVAGAMSFIQYLPVKHRMFYYVFANTKEGCFCLVLLQYVEHIRGSYWVWPVVESEVNNFFFGIYIPGAAGIKFFEQPWCFNEVEHSE